MRYHITLLLLLFSLGLSAQNKPDYVNTEVYESHFYTSNLAFARHCFWSEKIERNVKKPDRYYLPPRLDSVQFEGLNALEHFIYAFQHPEWYHQSCSMFPFPTNLMQKIPASLNRVGEGVVMSPRQTDAIIAHRDSVILLMDQCIKENNSVSEDFKRAILLLDAKELIPTLLSILEKSKDPKDPYLLTVLCKLMRWEYGPFMESEVGQALYPDSLKFEFFKREYYQHHVPFTQANYDTIVHHAKQFSHWITSKPESFATVQAGKRKVGQEGHSTNPLRETTLYMFQISKYEVTNRQFAEFVKQTGYVTLAETRKDAFVFEVGLPEFEWKPDPTANWRFPNGVSQGGIKDKMDHPVTCISFLDAQAYCKWAGVRLPTVDEWEIASRGGGANRMYGFGQTADSISYYANIWKGKDHLAKASDEDYLTTSPVGSFLPNQLGIYDMYGNVFEFCSNIPAAFVLLPNVAATRGGSWWCSANACGFYNSIDIGRVQKEASFSNNGFRVVR